MRGDRSDQMQSRPRLTPEFIKLSTFLRLQFGQSLARNRATQQVESGGRLFIFSVSLRRERERERERGGEKRKREREGERERERRRRLFIFSVSLRRGRAREREIATSWQGGCYDWVCMCVYVCVRVCVC